VRFASRRRQLAEAYKIDAVPAMGVHGRYYTNGNLANAGQPAKGVAVGNERLLAVVEPWWRRRASPASDPQESGQRARSGVRFDRFAWPSAQGLA
jgi:hypothetical protein